MTIFVKTKQSAGNEMPPQSSDDRQLTEIMREVVEHFGGQVMAAKAAGVKQPSVSDWVTGKAKPSLRSLLLIQKKSKGKFKAKEIRPELFV